MTVTTTQPPQQQPPEHPHEEDPSKDAKLSLWAVLTTFLPIAISLISLAISLLAYIDEHSSTLEQTKIEAQQSQAAVSAAARLVYWTNNDGQPVITNLGEQALSDVVILLPIQSPHKFTFAINIRAVSPCTRETLDISNWENGYTNDVNGGYLDLAVDTVRHLRTYGWAQGVTQQPILYFSDSAHHGWSLSAYSAEAIPAQPTFKAFALEKAPGEVGIEPSIRTTTPGGCTT